MNNRTSVAIVTGASRGIGAAIARRLVDDGLAVVINYAGKASEAEELASDLAGEGGRSRSRRTSAIRLPWRGCSMWPKRSSAASTCW